MGLPWSATIVIPGLRGTSVASIEVRANPWKRGESRVVEKSNNNQVKRIKWKRNLYYHSPHFPAPWWKSGIVCDSSQTRRNEYGGPHRLGDSRDEKGNIGQKRGRRKPLSHPDITIKCSLTLCCIERGEQERRHSSLMKEWGFGRIRDGPKDEE